MGFDRQKKSGFVNKGRDRNFKDFRKYEHKPAVNKISELKDGDYFEGVVKITRKAIPGPVVFSVSDGFKTVDAVTKVSNFKEGDVVELKGEANERAGILQVEIEHMAHTTANFDKIIEQNAKPEERESGVKSARYDKLKPIFIKIATRLRKAVLENQPIYIRHHSDADGITSGLAIEKSCRLFMEEVGINPDYNLYRSLSRAPFYEITDVLRDISFTKRVIEAHGQKKPLIVVTDNGSAPSDTFAMKTLKLLGSQICRALSFKTFSAKE